jgi:hypothetical protein
MKITGRRKDEGASSLVRQIKGEKLESAAHLEVPPGRRKNQDRITIDKLWENPNRVAEACLISDVIACQVVTSDNLCVQQRVVCCVVLWVVMFVLDTHCRWLTSCVRGIMVMVGYDGDRVCVCVWGGGIRIKIYERKCRGVL